MRVKFVCLAVALLLTLSNHAQSGDEAAIRKILKEQQDFWNKADLDNFMKGYWNSDSLRFIGSSGITYGYARTLENYRKNYPGAEGMGKLSFDILHVERLSPEYYHVTGKWMVGRTGGDLKGMFTLLFRKFGQRWLIVADHSS